jgi:3-deoxy-D-manno-octulosonic-acid transferase
VFGPHMFHFEEISQMALERGAARQVHDVAGLVAALTLYFEQPDLRRAAGRAAHTLVTANRGALARTLVLVEDALRLAGSALTATSLDAGARAAASIAAAPRD